MGLGARQQHVNDLLTSRRLNLSAREEANLLRQFCMLIGSGFQFFDGLNVLAEGMQGPARALCEEVAEDVRKGMALSQAFAKRRERMTPMTPFLIEAGEKSGRLVATLRLAAEWAESNKEVFERVKSALVYPMFVLLVNILMAVGLLVFVLPAFIPLFGDQKLPLITQFVLGCSRLLQNPIVWLILGLGLAELLVSLSKPTSRTQLYSLGLSLPVLGSLLRCAAKTRFLAVIAITGQTGLPIAQGLKLAARSCGDNRFLEADAEVQEALLGGELLEDIFERNKDIYGDLISQGMRLSVETGNFAGVCGSLSQFYKDETEYWADKIKVLVEPLLMIFVAATTSVILLATYMPLATFIRTLLD